jgi:hypothetical protein
MVFYEVCTLTLIWKSPTRNLFGKYTHRDLGFKSTDTRNGRPVPTLDQRRYWLPKTWEAWPITILPEPYRRELLRGSVLLLS